MTTEDEGQIEPELYVAPPLPPPGGNWFQRGVKAIFLEHRLPYAVEKVTDRVCHSLGFRDKTVSVQGCNIRLQRLGTGPLFIQNIILNAEYNPSGYEIQDGDTVIDIGGNIGVFAVLAARQARSGRVLAFEPIRDNYRLLEQNIVLNGLTNLVAHKVAISNERSRVKIYLCQGNSGTHSIHENRASDLASYEEVPSVTLAEIIDENKIDRCNFLKIDCEGAEFEILYGLSQPYFDRIDKIALEYHCSSFEKKREEGRNLVQHLQRAGFQCDLYREFVKFRGGQIFARRRNK